MREKDNKNHSKIALVGKGSTEQIPIRRQNYDWILGKLEVLSAFFFCFNFTNQDKCGQMANTMNIGDRWVSALTSIRKNRLEMLVNWQGLMKLTLEYLTR